jgi:undecaprenyl-diphosphatase
MIFFFRRDLKNLAVGLGDGGETGRSERRRVVLIAAATVVTGAIGLSLKGVVEGLAVSYGAAGFGFLATAGVLVWGETRGRRWTGESLIASRAPLWHALAIGAAQGAAVWPGLSRSASTIAVALALGWGWGEAGRFSFLAAMPAIAGATLLLARDMTALPLVPALAGFLAAFAVGTFSLKLLMRFLSARRLWPFAIYTFGLGIYALLKWSRSM